MSDKPDDTKPGSIAPAADLPADPPDHPFRNEQYRAWMREYMKQWRARKRSGVVLPKGKSNKIT